MNQNKIIDHIFKKLLAEQYSNQEIINFVALRYRFNKFEYFIYYLWLLANNKNNNDHEYYKYAFILKDYLWTIIDRYNIESLDIDNLVSKQLVSNYELYLLNIKNYNSKQWFYIINDEYFIFFINQFEHKIENNKLLIKLDDHFNYDWWKRFNNFLKFNHKRLLVFDKNDINNEFINYFYFNDIEWKLNKQNNTYDYWLILDTNKDNIQTNHLQQIDDDYLLFQKQLNKQFNHHWINKITNDNNHSLLVANAIINYCIINYQTSLLQEFIKTFQSSTLISIFKPLNLIANQTIIDQFHLLLLINSFDFVYMNLIISDFMNNIYIVYDDDESNDWIKFNKQQVILKLVNNHNHLLFDHSLNKKIFNTINQPTSIYIFKRLKNNYLFKGFYKVEKIFLDNKIPTFILINMNNNELIDHYCYLINDELTNDYENIFINKLNQEFVSKWSSDLEAKPINKYNVKLDRINSWFLKYNWIFNKCISCNELEELKKYLEIYNEFYFRINNFLNELKHNQYKSLIEAHFINIDYFIYFYYQKSNDEIKAKIKSFFEDESMNYEQKKDFILSLINN